MKVTVTVADAEMARHRWLLSIRGRHCPLAIALQREFPLARVGGAYVTLGAMATQVRKLTIEAGAFVLLADEYHDDPVALGLPREIEVWADEAARLKGTE